jgi:glycosyltransferase EpsD
MGSVLTRIAVMLCKNKTRIIYTAHGFHFYKGAPVLNWIFYYPVEKLLSYFTYRLITMNEEDFVNGERLLNQPLIDRISGVGVDLCKYSVSSPEQKADYKKKFGFNENDFLILCVGELNSVKRQDVLINAVSRLCVSFPGLHLLLAGAGEKKSEFEKQVRDFGIQKNVHFLGYRKDVPDLLKAADISVSSSSREGLPLNLLEAMSAGLPIIASDCRGNRDLVRHGQNGFLVRFGDVESYCRTIDYMINNPEKMRSFGVASKNMAEKYSVENVESEMMRIYNDSLPLEVNKKTGAW